MKLATLFTATLLLATGTVFAQKGVVDGSKFGHGEDSVRCLTNASLYTEYFKQKNYKDAFPYWEIAFNECPLSYISLYTNGVRIMQNFYETETNPAKKEEYYQYLMKIYDQRIKYFGNNTKYPTPYILGIRAVDMLRYKRDDVEVMKEAYDLLLKAIAGRGTKTQAAVLQTHMTNTVALFKAGQLEAEKVVDVYVTVSDIVESQMQGKNDDEDDNSSIGELKSNIDKVFAISGAADCETINRIFAPQFEANKTELLWLKRVSNLLTRQECENDLVFNVSASLHKIEPSANAARGLAVMCLKNKETDKAIEFYKEAIELETNAEQKGNLYFQLGSVYMANNNYSVARAQFNRAIELRPGWGAPYIMIGQLYGGSASSIGSNEFEHKTAYWAAVDKFIKAKTVDPSISEQANEQIAIYSAHFPNKEEIFFQGMKEGGNYSVGGWISESTTVRAKR